MRRDGPRVHVPGLSRKRVAQQTVLSRKKGPPLETAGEFRGGNGPTRRSEGYSHTSE